LLFIISKQHKDTLLRINQDNKEVLNEGLIYPSDKKKPKVVPHYTRVSLALIDFPTLF
jgi:hypothetical protein